MEARLRSTLINLNEWNVLQKTLLRYEMAQVAVHKDERHFDLKGLESAYFPIKWQSSVSVDVYLVNSHKTAAGLATSPAIGNMIIITLQHDYLPGVRPVTDIAGILAHELGHYWSSEHRSGLGNRHNIMTPGHPHNVFNNRADPKQIELWHTTLARHPMRIRDRRE